MQDLIDFVELNETIRRVVGQYSVQDASRVMRLYPATITKHLHIPEEIVDLGRDRTLSRADSMPLRAYMYLNAEEIAAVEADLRKERCLTDLKPFVGMAKDSSYFVVIGLNHLLDEIDYTFDDVKGRERKYSSARLEEILEDHDRRRKTRKQLMKELGNVTSSRLTQVLTMAANHRRSYERYKMHGLLPHIDVHGD